MYVLGATLVKLKRDGLCCAARRCAQLNFRLRRRRPRTEVFQRVTSWRANARQSAVAATVRLLRGCRQPFTRAKRLVSFNPKTQSPLQSRTRPTTSTRTKIQLHPTALPSRHPITAVDSVGLGNNIIGIFGSQKCGAGRHFLRPAHTADRYSHTNLTLLLSD